MYKIWTVIDYLYYFQKDFKEKGNLYIIIVIIIIIKVVSNNGLIFNYAK